MQKYKKNRPNHPYTMQFQAIEDSIEDAVRDSGDYGAKAFKLALEEHKRQHHKDGSEPELHVFEDGSSESKSRQEEKSGGLYGRIDASTGTGAYKVHEGPHVSCSCGKRVEFASNNTFSFGEIKDATGSVKITSAYQPSPSSSFGYSNDTDEPSGGFYRG